MMVTKYGSIDLRPMMQSFGTVMAGGQTLNGLYQHATDDYRRVLDGYLGAQCPDAVMSGEVESCAPVRIAELCPTWSSLIATLRQR